MSKSNIRRISQGIFLLTFLFLFIQTESKGNDTLGYPVRLFLDFDPFIFLTTLFAAHGRNIPRAFFLSVSFIVLTIFLGRIFCGWICPLGTLHNIASSFGIRHPVKIPPDWHKAKYFILSALLISSLFTLQIAGITDPISLLIRSFSLSMYPLVNNGTRSFFDALYQLKIP
ncbi:MAG: 4Fe-4S binding protein, partial [Syntrophales bacterium LBB04]|nr:4Fe-4S binding protein [Syntrophales bacterium LBB04]